jgi:hypothetical protein
MHAGSKSEGGVTSENNAYSEVITAGLIVKIIDERPFYPVIKEDSHHTEPSRQRRMFLFNYVTSAPEGKAPVFDGVSHLQIQLLSHKVFYTKRPRGLQTRVMGPRRNILQDAKRDIV